MPCAVCGGTGKHSCACTRKAHKEEAIKLAAEVNSRRLTREQRRKAKDIVYVANPMQGLRVGPRAIERFIELAQRLGQSNDQTMDLLLRAYERHYPPAELPRPADTPVPIKGRAGSLWL